MELAVGRRAAGLVQALEAINEERKRLTEEVLAAARVQAEQLAGEPVLVLRGEQWPSGVIGLVAARLADAYSRPVVVVEVGQDACRGSGRSVAGFDLVAALGECADLLIEFGGHPGAAGFAVHPHHLDELVSRLSRAAATLPPAAPAPADSLLDETQLDWALHRALGALRPFGAANPEPRFATDSVRLLEAKSVGQGKHLRLRCRFGRQVLTAFGPDLGSLAGSLQAAGRADLLYSLDTNTWNGLTSLELRLLDAYPA